MSDEEWMRRYIIMLNAQTERVSKQKRRRKWYALGAILWTVLVAWYAATIWG